MTIRITHLLKAEDECLGALDLVSLPGFAQSLFDDVTVIVIVLRTGNEVRWRQGVPVNCKKWAGTFQLTFM